MYYLGKVPGCCCTYKHGFHKSRHISDRFSKNVSAILVHAFLNTVLINPDIWLRPSIFCLRLGMQNHVFHKIFNRNTVKISYSCMPNLKQKIDGRNKSILEKTTAPPILKACNCQRPADCPMAGNCLRSSVIYQATVTTDDSRPAQSYVGLTETSFKRRFTNHKSSFNDPSKRLSTELSKHVWHLKEAKLKFRISRKILKQATPLSPVTNRCNLYLWEKYFIICRPELATLNRRNELVTSCRHANKFLLKNFKPIIATR